MMQDSIMNLSQNANYNDSQINEGKQGLFQIQEINRKKNFSAVMDKRGANTSYPSSVAIAPKNFKSNRDEQSSSFQNQPVNSIFQMKKGLFWKKE